MSELAALFGPEVVAAIGRFVDERVEAAVAERQTGSNSTPWLTVSEAAEHLRTSERTIQRLLKRGRIHSSTIGRRRLLHRDELDAYVRATAGRS